MTTSTRAVPAHQTKLKRQALSRRRAETGGINWVVVAVVIVAFGAAVIGMNL